MKNIEQTESITAGPAQAQPNQKKKSRRGKGLLTFILLVAVVALGWGYYTKNQEVEALKNPEVKAAMEQKEIEGLVATISKIILLPTGETPQVLTINDAAAAIKQQAAFAGSVNGDKVLIYSKASKAFIYSPSRNIIVNVLPVTLSNDNTNSASAQNNTSSQTNTEAKSTSKSSSTTSN